MPGKATSSGHLGDVDQGEARGELYREKDEILCTARDPRCGGAERACGGAD
jgi:hypothetical protein